MRLAIILPAEVSWKRNKMKDFSQRPRNQSLWCTQWLSVVASSRRCRVRFLLSYLFLLSINIQLNKCYLRWLDIVFQGQYLPRLSINYVAINKDLEKLTPQLQQIKMKICYDQGCMTSELSQQRNDAITYFTCNSVSRHWELFFQNRLLELLPTIAVSLSELSRVVHIYMNRTL